MRITFEIAADLPLGVACIITEREGEPLILASDRLTPEERFAALSEVVTTYAQRSWVYVGDLARAG